MFYQESVLREESKNLVTLKFLIFTIKQMDIIHARGRR